MKYGNTPVVVGGRRFASKAEAKRYGELQLLERTGAIRDLRCQPRYVLDIDGDKVGTYVGDFSYEEKGKEVCEDVKGVQTQLFRLKWKIVKLLYPTTDFRVVP